MTAITWHRDEAADGLAQGVLVDTDGSGVIVLRRGERVWGFRNRCPHRGVPLDYGDGRCLFQGELECALHQARFRVADGRCTDGPCRGDRLTPVALEVVDGVIRIVSV